MLTKSCKRSTMFAVAIALIHGCADGVRDVQDPQAGVASASYSVNAAELASLCAIGRLMATLSVDGGTPQQVTVDCAQRLITGQLTGLSTGMHRFDLDLHRDSVWIIRRSASAQLAAESTATLSFGAPNYIDSDGDGYTNLAELNIYGQSSNAWLNASLRPPAETPRFSASYVMSDTFEEKFIEGASSSADYQLIYP